MIAALLASCLLAAAGPSAAPAQEAPPSPTQPVQTPARPTAAQAAAAEGNVVPLEYSSVTEMLDGDQRIGVFQNPLLRFENREIRATWAMLWVDKDAKSFLEGSDPTELRVGAPATGPETRAGGRASSFSSFDDILNAPQLRVVRELYLEGPVEFFEDGERVAHADALYVDRVEGHGWLSDAHLEVRERIGGSRFVFEVQADWLRISADGSLRSDRARLTTCEHAAPHYYVRTKQLRMEPTDDPQFPWRVSLSGNAIRILDAVTIPLPPINYLADEEGEPAIRNLRLGSSSRFGPTVGFGYSRDVAGVGAGLNKLLRGDPTKFQAKFRVDISYLGSRGLLLDNGLRLRSEGRYRWDTYFGFIPDGDEDKGLVRVEESDRDTLRSWFRSRARFEMGRDEWLDTVVSAQSDAGVQAEFFEDEYLEFEERETYVHWRKADGLHYWSATAAGSLDQFRTRVEELPEVEFARQRATLFEVGSSPLVYSTESSGGWYRRKEGDPLYEVGFADGLGERETWRFDTKHRLELPLPLGVAGLRLIPFTLSRFTGWTEPQTGEDDPWRAALIGGARLTTTFWRRTSGGGLQELAPLIGWSAEGVLEETGGEPVPFDEVEDELAGRFWDFGLRGRLRDTRFVGLPFDLHGEVRARHGSNLEGPEQTRWQPLEILAGAETRFGPVPVGVFHDGRYDLEDGSTDYARTLLSFQPIDRLDVDLGFTVGRDAADAKLFEAATLGAIYRFTPKWELEARQTLEIENGDSLNTKAIVRRFGHDLIVDYYVQRRSGEGGSSFGISIKPAFTEKHRPRPLLPGGDFSQ
jgi:hypothetical protein